MFNVKLLIVILINKGPDKIPIKHLYNFTFNVYFVAKYLI